MIANLTTGAGIYLPGSIDQSGTAFSSIPTGFGAFDSISSAGIAQIIGFVGFLELFVLKDVDGTGEFPGDFRNGTLDYGWDNFDAETQAFKRGVELNNGRAAMMGILGMMVHEQLNGEPLVINKLLCLSGSY